MADSNNPPTPAKTEKKTKERSPSYPAIGLRRAIELAQKLWDLDKRQSVLVPRAISNMGFSPKSSGGFVSLSSMKKYGLLDEEGSNDVRKVKLTDAAINILNPSSSNREGLIKAAALRPTIHRELWGNYGADLPSDGTIRDYLTFERKFTDEAAKALIAQFRDTIAFAKLSDADKIPDTEAIEETPNGPKVEPVMQNPAKHNGATPSGTPLPLQHAPPMTIPGLIDFPVPLPSGAVAYYRLPASISEADFAFYQNLLNALKAGLVRPQQTQGTKPDAEVI